MKRIIFSSSSTVFGDPEYLPIDENHPTGKCTNTYGRTKYFVEEMIKDVCNSDKVICYGDIIYFCVVQAALVINCYRIRGLKKRK